MNKIYKVIWSKVRNCYVAVSEIAKRNGKSCTSVNCGAKANRGHAGVALSAAVGATLLAGVCSVLLPVRVALAAPVMPTLDYKGGTVKAASPYVTINSNASGSTATMNISSTQPNNVLKWIDFSIGKGGTVQFDTRNYLNYVIGHGRSEIDGTLKGAGNIYLINPNGILFGSNASVDVGNLYLSTRKLTPSELTNFTNSGTNPLDNPSSYVLGSEIINLGKLKATNIIVEGKNITFKNVADVTPTNTINVRARTDGGEVHVGYAASSVVNAVNTTEYTNGHITQPNLSKWIFKNEASETIEPTKYMLVRNAYELQNMQNNKSSETIGTWTYVDYVGNFMLANDIDFNGTTFSPGFKPIGYNDETNKIEYRFVGKFDGLNYKIKNLKITDGTDGTAVTLPADASDSIGLFGVNRGTIENLGVENTTINVSKNSVGGVVGTNNGVVRNVYHTGSVKGAGNVGGIVGDSASYGSEAIKASYNTGNVTGTNNVGGIAGYQSTTAKIEVVFNEGSVNGETKVGGITGYAKNVFNSYNTGEVKGTDYVGGITGEFNNNNLQKSYNVGKVTGTTHAGGIAGSDGTAQYGSRITYCVFSKGPDNGIGTYVEDEANMKKRTTFSMFSMTTSGNTTGSIWRIYEGQTIPFLAAFLKNKDVVTATEYNGAEQSFVMPSDSHILGSVSISRTSAGRDTKNNVLYSSDQLGYDLFDTVLLIQPKQLTIGNVSKEYDGTTAATLAVDNLAGVVNGDATDLTVTTTSATYNTKNVGTGRTVTYNDIKLGGDKKNNYIIVDSATGTGSITAKPLTVGNVTKVYDGEATAPTLTVANLQGVVDGDATGLSISSGVTANYTGDKAADAETGKTVEYSGLTISGTASGNYTIAESGTSTTGNSITPKQLSATFNTISKVYDGGTDGIPNIILTGVVGTDDVSATATATYENKNAGTEKRVDYSGIGLEGEKAANYVLDAASAADQSVAGNSITKKELKLVADKVSIKMDGTVPSNFTGRITGFVPGESLGAGDRLTFALTKDETPAAVGFYGVTGKLNDASNGDYGTNYTFTNDPANASAFSIVVGVMPKLDFKGASPYVTIASTPDTMNISSLQTNNVLKWMDFSIDKDGTVNFDTNNYLNYVTGHGRSEIDGTLTGGGNIYLINPNGMLFGSTAQVNVGNLYLSTRKFGSDDDLTDNLTAYINNKTIPDGSTVLGDVTNLGKLNANGVVDSTTNIITNTIEVEGKNISFKSIADVTTGGTITNGKLSGGTLHNNVNLTSHGGEIHLGFAVGEEVNTVNNTQYTNVTPPTLTGWTTDGTTYKYMLVRNAYELQNMKNKLTGNYMLANDINFKNANNELVIEHFQPIGRKPGPNVPEEGMFQGRLDGLNHVISDIRIKKIDSTGEGDVGMIGSNAGVVENLGVINGEIYVPSFNWVGGIVGANKTGGIIRNVYFTGSVTGAWAVGGIAGGQNGGSSSLSLPGASIEKAYNAGTIIGLRNSSTRVGGIVGSNGGTVKEAYNTGTISSSTGQYVGGIAGRNSANIENVYNTGTISGNSYIGGIVGYHDGGATRFAYNTGNISGTQNVGGIVGYRNNGSVFLSYFTKGGGYGNSINDSQLKQSATFAGSGITEGERWNMSQTGGAGTVWRIYEGQTAPLLTAFLKTKDVITETEYDGSAQPFDTELVTGDNHITATNVGGYASERNAKKHDGLTGGKVLYSDQLGYDLVDTKMIIQPKRVSLVNASKTYDGSIDVNATTLSLNADEIIVSDSNKVTLVYNNVTGKYADKNAGDGKAITYTIADGALTGDAAGNYIISAAGTGNITAKTLNLVSVSKVYDGTANVEAGDIGITETDIVTNDKNNVTFDSSKVTGSYADKNVGTGKGVTYTVNAGALTGTEAGNYVISTAGTGVISKANVTLTVENVVKTYDGTTAVTGKTLMVKSGSGTIFDSDSLGGGTFAFKDKNVGDGNKTVTVAGGTITDKTSGVDTSGNYNITYEDNTTSTISPKALTATFADITKVYDGTTNATAGVGTLSGVESGDTGKVSVSASAAYDQKNAGSRTVNYTGVALSGTEAGNYSIATTTTGKGTITPKALTATFADITKVYDGTTGATAGVGTLSGVESDDTGKVSVSASAAYDQKNAGSRTVNYTGVALSGDEAANYSIATMTTGKGTITPKALTATFADISKTYDGTTNATAGVGTLTGVESGDTGKVSVSASAAYDDKNVGSRTVNYTGVALSGAEAGNYSIATTTTGKGTITPKALTATFADITKVYDGTTSATAGVGTLSGVESDDTGKVSVSASAAYDEKNAGSRIVDYTGVALSGTEAGNYSIATTTTGKGTITPKALTATFADITKVYDGTTGATAGVGTLSGVASGDTGKVSVSASAAYDEKNVGSRTVNYTGVALSGTEAGNYSIATTTTGKGTITPKELTATFADISKTYDGTTSATAGAGTLAGVIAADEGKVSVSASAAYDQKNAGSRIVNYSGVALSGDEAANYSIATTATGAGTITPKTIAATFADISKVYDGTTSATTGAGTLSGVETVDTGNVSVSASAAYDEKNAGRRTVNYTGVTLSGSEAANYSIATTATGAGTITPKELTATFADISKIYDGTTNTAPGAGTLTGVIATDEGKVNVSATDASYDEKNAGNRTVNYTGVALSGAEAGNYSIATTATGNGTIGRKALELVADPASTEYGDYNPASFTGRVDGFVAGESVSNGDSLQFALSDPSASAVGSYGITGTINGSSSGDYGLNYSFTNAASNANAFVIYARPASVQDMVLSDIIPGIKGMTGANISVTALDNSLEQATDKKAEVGIEFAVAQTILSVDAEKTMSLENQGMKQPPAMTPKEVAEQVHAQQGNGNGVAAQVNDNTGAPVAQVNGNAGVTGNEGATGITGNGVSTAAANENGAASNAGVAGAVNAAMDVVQQTDNAVGTEESKKKKGVA